MVDIDAVTSQVKHNCNISDAKYWGFYSPCGLLLRMRDLYKFEHALQPWDTIESGAIMDWMGRREDLWQELEESRFCDIEINGDRFDPFASDDINSTLRDSGYYYTAGYGNALKPVFVLAELTAKQREGSYSVYRVGREIARDLSTSPAMLQGSTIIARRETMTMFLWQKYEEMRSRKCIGSLHAAFAEYGISQDTDRESVQHKFTVLVQDEMEPLIYHEMGEASLAETLDGWWKELLLEIPNSRAEIFVRAVRDVLSDTCSEGMLAYIYENRRVASLSFYVSLLSGYRRVVFPEILTAYKEFTRTGEWAVIEKIRGDGYSSALETMKRLKVMSAEKSALSRRIEDELIPAACP